MTNEQKIIRPTPFAVSVLVVQMGRSTWSTSSLPI